MRQLTSVNALLFSLLISFCAVSAPSENLVARAESNDTQAQLLLGQEYLAENKIKQAHFWLLKSALNGNLEALSNMGSLYEGQENAAISSLSLAENWYQAGSEQSSEEADQGYSRVLEKQFNQRRAKQVSAIAILDKAADEALIQKAARLDSEESNRGNKISVEVIVISVLILLVVLFVTIRRFFRTRKQNKSADQSKKLAEKERKILTLQKSLNRTFDQLKKVQQQNQKQSKDQSFALACAVLGFTPKNVPDDKVLKARYKKLCRVYHPDAGGSDEDMRRLNTAVKILSSRK
ncbi:hypothetical protein L3Q72_06500 [Vibrio sp. JC009]|uniref:hypothetical protein n=1 Tax=Vibrio sp. JC009 TaxID=2912314 RepID=UPI0023AE78CC|nr:hypothetical protein [Vibrio sp. JC009]WED23039.1 hypothetical protein L3Q72_06500 [Vibrio sp. JC009]